MKLADIVGRKVVIHPDLFAIPAFNKLWNSFEDKDLVTKYIWYIVLKNRYNSPYVETMYSEDIEPTLKREMFNDSEYELPQVVLEAEQKFISLEYTLLQSMLDGALGKLQDVDKYYKSSKGEALDLDSVKKLTDGMKNLSGTIKSITDLKLAIIKEEVFSNKVRGGSELNPYELPDNKL